MRRSPVRLGWSPREGSPLKRGFLILVSIALVLTLVRLAGFRHVGQVWRSVEPRGIAISVACYYASIGVRVLAWRRLLGPGGPPAGALAPPLALGFVLGHVTPAKSGEPATALLVSRAFGLPLPRTLSVLTAERAVQLLVLLATFVPAAAASAGEALAVRGAVRAAAALLALLVPAALLAPPSLRRLGPLLRRLPRGGGPASLYAETLADLLSSPSRVLPLLGLAALFWGLQYLSLWAILDAGGTDVNPVGAAAVAGAAILGGTLTMLPLGTQDGISALALASLGVPPAVGFALALFHTLLSLACGLLLLSLLPLAARRPK